MNFSIVHANNYPLDLFSTLERDKVNFVNHKIKKIEIEGFQVSICD